MIRYREELLFFVEERLSAVSYQPSDVCRKNAGRYREIIMHYTGIVPVTAFMLAADGWRLIAVSLSLLKLRWGNCIRAFGPFPLYCG